MKTIGVRFVNKGEPSEDIYSYICPDDIYASIIKGSYVVADTRYGPSLAQVVKLDWKNPPVQPYKVIISFVKEQSINMARRREDAVRKREMERKSIEESIAKELKNFSPIEIATLIVSQIQEPVKMGGVIDRLATLVLKYHETTPYHQDDFNKFLKDLCER